MILKRASQLSKKFQGDCLSQKAEHISVVKGQQSIKFKCEQGHVFYKPVDELSFEVPSRTRKFSLQTAANSDDDSDDSQQWCPKCVAFYRNCQSTAQQYGFVLQGKLFGSLAFSCSKADSHLSKISYSRRITNSSPLVCIQCHKQERERVKSALKDEEQEKQDYFARMQEACFQKASAAMQEELKNQEEPAKQAAFEMTDAKEEQDLNSRATFEAEMFLKNESCNFESLSTEQAYLTYKFVFISEELIVKGLMGMPQQAWSQWYRAMAKQLHPDKNCHPQAKEAF